MRDTNTPTKENSSKLSDLFDDLQETLDNSILNPEKSNQANQFNQFKQDNQSEQPENITAKKSGLFSENETVSELFDTLNSKPDNSFRSESQQAHRSIFDEIGEKPSVNKFKVELNNSGKTKPAKKSVGVNPVESFLSAETSIDIDDLSGNAAPAPDYVYNTADIDAVKVTKPEDVPVKQPAANATEKTENSAETEDADFDFNMSDDSADMDMELLKAIGIGQQTGNASAEKKSRVRDTSAVFPPRKEKPERTAKTEKTAVKKPSALSLHKIAGKEYTDREQLTGIFESYRKAYKSELIRLALSIILFLLIFYMEVAPYMSWPIFDALDIRYANPPYIWINMQILLIIAALNLKSLIYGAKSMLASNINVYSIAVFFFSLSFIHTLITLFMRSGFKPDGMPNIVLYNSITVYCMILVTLYNILDMSSEITSLKTVSSKKPKYALSLDGGPAHAERPYSSVRLESELFNDIIPYETSVGGVVKTAFASNFFSRTYRDKHPGGHIKYFVYLSMFAAMMLFVFHTIFGEQTDWYDLLSAIAALMLGSVPLCSFIISVYPVSAAQKKAREAGAAFIGGRSLEESAETSIVSLYDRDIFPPSQIKLTSIKVYGSNKIETVLQNLCAVFDKLGMPPSDTFKATANSDDSYTKNIEIVAIDDYGVCYTANGRKLFLGRPEYISNMGFLPPIDQNFDEPFIKSAGSIMILASETEVVAKVYIKYELTADFPDIVKTVKRINACLCIRTFDPNIDNAFIAKLGSLKKYPIRVLKLNNPADTQKTPERMDSPVISKESVKSLLTAVSIAVRAKNVIKINILIQAVAFGVGIILSFILGFAGHLWGINAGHLFLFQSFWLLPVFLMQWFTQ